MPDIPAPVVHGFTLADIDRLARTAVSAARAVGMDGLTRYETAWSTIAEHLVEAEEPPSRTELIRAGWRAINAEAAACLHARGYRNGHAHQGPASSPRYLQYWNAPLEDNAIDRLVDHLAAVQIGDLFTRAQGEAVEALARHDDHALAAASLGIPYKTFASRLSAARQRFQAAWYAPETAPRLTHHDKRRGGQVQQTHCRAGHELAGENLRIQIRKGGRKERCCRACEADRTKARTQAARSARPRLGAAAAA